MSKNFIIRCAFFVIVGLVFFNACVKDKGKPVPPLFNFNSVEGFEGGTGLPSGWTLYNPDADEAWQIVTTVAKTGTNCVGFDNCSGDGGTVDMTGRRDRLISPSYDFTKATSASISFDVAYALLNFKGQVFSDTLIIYSSIDEGSTWNQIYFNDGANLTNIPETNTSTPCWSPAGATDWRNDYVDVKSLAGKAKVKFAFENRSGWGEWIYLDNITITASNGNSNCDGITYTKDILPIIQNQCATSGCHVAGGTGPTDFSSFAGVKADADNGSLKKRMIDGNPSFMPAAGKLPDSDLSKVRCWLSAGAPNN